jgi:hypothetical protein
VAKPPIITAFSSDNVMPGMNGRTTSGASVWPMNTLALVESVSAPLVPSVHCITQARPLTTG